MALLPQQILPETDSWGRLLPDGTVRINHDWYLMLYNLWLNVLGTGSAQSLPADALQELAAADSDAADSDAIALRRPIQNLANLIPIDADPSSPPWMALKALILAQDVLLPDPAAAAQPIQSVTPGASPWVYTAPFNGVLLVKGGTVSAISFVRQGASVTTALTAGLFPLRRLDQLSITYTAAPTVNFFPD